MDVSRAPAATTDQDAKIPRTGHDEGQGRRECRQGFLRDRTFVMRAAGR